MIRVFPVKTALTPSDGLVRFEAPSMEDIGWGEATGFDMPVRVSCVFTWHKRKAEWLARQWMTYFPDVEIGGPAYDDPGGEFTPNMFVGNGALITSRGCPHACDFCLVPRREGALRELEVKDGWNILDNNLLACSEPHLDKVFLMLSRQKHPIKFSGGLEARAFRPDHLERIAKINLGELWFAADSEASLEPLQLTGKMLDDADIPVRKRRCYVLFDPSKDTLDKAHYRATRVLKMGFLPFAQVRRDEETTTRKISPNWAKLNKFWAKPQAFLSPKAIDPISKRYFYTGAPVSEGRLL